MVSSISSSEDWFKILDFNNFQSEDVSGVAKLVRNIRICDQVTAESKVGFDNLILIMILT